MCAAAYLGQHARGRSHGGIEGEAAASVTRCVASMQETAVPEGGWRAKNKKKHGVANG